MKRTPLLLAVVALLSLTLPAGAQDQRLFLEGGFGIVGQGAQRIPSGQLSYAYEAVPHVDLINSVRVSHIQTYGSEDLLQRADLTYLNVSVGITLHPLDTRHHRIDLGISGTIRGRWEREAVRAKWYSNSKGE
jgi:hypothetical protein